MEKKEYLVCKILMKNYAKIVEMDFENKNKCKFYVNFCSLDLTKS